MGLFCRCVVGWRFVVFVVDGFVLLFCWLFVGCFVCCFVCWLLWWDTLMLCISMLILQIVVDWVGGALCVLFYLGEFVMVVYLLLLGGCFVFGVLVWFWCFGFRFGFIVFRCFVGCWLLV